MSFKIISTIELYVQLNYTYIECVQNKKNILLTIILKIKQYV